jgi:diguanylate cyclase (GGDEF)-like protein
MVKSTYFLYLLVVASLLSPFAHAQSLSRADIEAQLWNLHGVDSDMSITDKDALEIADEMTQKANALGHFDLAYVASSIATHTLVRLGRESDVEKRYQENLSHPAHQTEHDAKLLFMSAMMRVHWLQNDLVSAQTMLDKIENHLAIHDIQGRYLPAAYVELGVANHMLGHYRQAMAYMQKSIAFTEHFDMDEQLKLTAVNKLRTIVGDLYYELGDYQKMLDANLNAINFSIKHGHKGDIGIYQYNAALAYYMQKQWADALRYAEMGLAYYREHQAQVGEAMAMELMALSYRHLERYDESLTYQLGASKIYKQLDLFDYDIYAQINLALLYTDMGEVSLAESALQEVNAMKERKAADITRDKDYLEASYRVSKETKDYRQAMLSIESLLDVERKEVSHREKMQANRLMMEYEVDLSQKQTAALKKDNELKTALLDKKNAQERTQKIVTGVGVVALFVLIAFAVRERANASKQRKLALTDPLTGAPNRRAMEHHVLDALDNKDKRPAPIAIGVIDLDHFKQVNDTYGHDVGDAVLQQFVQVCTPCIRKEDVLGRIGGEEFLLVLPNANEKDIDAIFLRLQAALKSRPIIVEGKVFDIPVTISMGVSFEPESMGVTRLTLKERLNKLLKLADDSVYAAKSGGRDRYVISA